MICNYGLLVNASAHAKIRTREESYFDFEFPALEFRTRLYSDMDELTRDLTRLGIKNFFYKGKLFLKEELRSANGIKSILKCKHKECPARLIYFQKTGTPFYLPAVFENLHRHRKLKEPREARRQEISQFIMELRGAEYQSYRKVRNWCDRFDLTTPEGLYVIEQVYWSHSNEDEVLASLAHQNVIVRRLQYMGQTQLIFLATQSMRRSFAQFGDAISIQVHCETGKRKMTDHTVGYFFAQDYNARIILVGVFTMAEQNSATFKAALQFFFEAVGQSRMPISILTDHIESLTQALNEVKRQKGYAYSHLYSWHHATRRLIQRLRSVKEGKAVMELMCKAMQQVHEDHYCQFIQQLKTKLKDHPTVLAYFMANQNKFCIRRIPARFFGLAMSTSFGEKVADRISQSGVYRVHIGRFYSRLLKIQKQLLNEAEVTTKVSEVVVRHCPAEINQFRNRMEAEIIDLLLQNWNVSRDCIQEEINPIEVKVTQGNGKVFLCKFSIEYDHWECNCRQLERTGLVCPHLITVVLNEKRKGTLAYYMNSRWLHSKDKKVTLVRGRFISNRRRIH